MHKIAQNVLMSCGGLHARHELTTLSLRKKVCNIRSGNTLAPIPPTHAHLQAAGHLELFQPFHFHLPTHARLQAAGRLELFQPFHFHNRLLGLLAHHCNDHLKEKESRSRRRASKRWYLRDPTQSQQSQHPRLNRLNRLQSLLSDHLHLHSHLRSPRSHHSCLSHLQSPPPNSLHHCSHLQGSEKLIVKVVVNLVAGLWKLCSVGSARNGRIPNACKAQSNWLSLTRTTHGLALLVVGSLCGQIQSKRNHHK